MQMQMPGRLLALPGAGRLKAALGAGARVEQLHTTNLRPANPCGSARIILEVRPRVLCYRKI